MSYRTGIKTDRINGSHMSNKEIAARLYLSEER